jgi:hypothetical protein
MLLLHQQPPEQRINNTYLAPKSIRTNSSPNALSLELPEAFRSVGGALTLEGSHKIKALKKLLFQFFGIIMIYSSKPPFGVCQNEIRIN